MASNPVLSVNNLSLELKSGRGATSLVNNVSFKIPQRRVLGLIGESGCGKSLTCLAIMGLLPANIHQSGGEVFIDGRPMSGLKPAERRAIRGKTAAMVLQNPMSCFDSVFLDTPSFQGNPGFPRKFQFEGSRAPILGRPE